MSRWTVLSEVRRDGRKYYICRCECGTVKEVYYRSIESGASESCGCLRRELNREKGVDLTGRKIGKLTVLGRDAGRWGYWVCRCECGGRKSIVTASLRDGVTQSCGCIQRETVAKVGARTVAKNSEKQIAENMAYRTNFQIIGSQNLPKHNTSGHKGVSWDNSRSMWSAYIQVHGKKIHLGRFYEKADAIKARIAAEKEYFEPLIAQRAGGGMKV